MNTCKCGRLISGHKRLCLACMWQEAQRRTETMKIKPKEIKVCRWCGKEFFYKNSSLEIYCSDTCRGKAAYQHERDKLRHGTCIICGKGFFWHGRNERKRCDDCREADIRKPYRKLKTKAREKTKKSSAAEKAARLARLPEGANPADAWMNERGMMPVSESEAGKPMAKAVIRINPAKLRAPLLPQTRENHAELPEDAFYRKLAQAKKRQHEFDTKKPRNSHPNDGYTPDEDDMILDMTEGGATLEEISEILGRSKDGVKYRLKKLRTG